MVRLILVLSLAVLAGCARTSLPAPYELHTREGPPTLSEPAEPHPDRVAVGSGDTLYGIARRYGIPMRAIIDANHLQPPYRLVAGTSLALPQVKTYTVRAGDTLAVVARRNGADMSTLAAANHLGPPYVIRTGTTLVLPSPVEAPPAPPAEAVFRPPPPAKVVESAPLPPPPPSAAEATKNLPATAPAPAAGAAAKPPVPPASVLADAAPPDQTAAEAKPPAEEPPKQMAPSGRLAAAPPFPVTGSGFLWPAHGRVLAAFGTGPDGMHNDGINIAAPEGTPVLAAEAGEVAYAGNELKGYGNLVLIKHPDGFVTAYAHNATLLVKRGDKVERGQPIARVGATGAVSEPQLHFEIRRGTRALDPIEYLPAEAAAK